MARNSRIQGGTNRYEIFDRFWVTSAIAVKVLDIC